MSSSEEMPRDRDRETPPTRAPGRRLALRLALALSILVAGALSAELAARAWLGVRGHPYQSEATRQELLDALSALDRRVPFPGAADRDAKLAGTPTVEVLQPYYGCEALARLEEVETERRRYATPEAERAFDVMVLGGSVAHIVGNLSRERMERALAADPRLAGREVRLHVHARPAFKQPQQATLFVYLLMLGFRPDAVIELDGFNEVAIGTSNAANGVHPLYPYAGQWAALASGARADRNALDLLLELRERQSRAVAIARSALRWRLAQSCILGRAALGRLARARERAVEVYRRYVSYATRSTGEAEVRGPPFEGGRGAALEESVRAWAEGSRLIAAMCSSRGIRYLHVLQPTLHDEGSKPLTEEEREKGVAEESWREGARLGYPRLREEGAKLAAEGVRFFDGSRVFEDVRESLYYDLCHFDQRGCDILADAIVEACLGTLP
ncbi:MAG TPA: hypothetical protein VMS76_17995 [Planctomycetota bacterium]|nr:hypothetical protein [Planctomycetota bacterium]